MINSLIDQLINLLFHPPKAIEMLQKDLAKEREDNAALAAGAARTSSYTDLTQRFDMHRKDRARLLN